jgi:hypothetical protein
MRRLVVESGQTSGVGMHRMRDSEDEEQSQGNAKQQSDREQSGRKARLRDYLVSSERPVISAG